MKAHSWRRRLIILALALSPFSPAAKAGLTPPPPVPAVADIDQSPDNLALKQSLDQAYQDLAQICQATGQMVDNYRAQYANKSVEPGSAEENAGLAAYQQVMEKVASYKNALAAYVAQLAQLKPKAAPPAPPLPTPPPPPQPPVPQVNLYVDPASLLVRNETKYDIARIQAEIDGLRKALATLNSVKNMNDSQREEWLKESEKASRDAWKLGADLAADVLEANSGEGKAAESAEKAPEAIDTVKTAREAIDKMTESGAETEDTKELLSRGQQVSQALEKGWDAAAEAEALPPGASEAKAMVDAAYLAAVQAVSVARANATADDEARYLTAVTAVSQKMDALVRELNDRKAAQAAAQAVSVAR